jgi:hypothetical protein
MKVQWTEWPTYESMQKIWETHPKVEPIDFALNYDGIVKEILDETMIITDGNFFEVEVPIDKIQIL